MQPSSTTPFDTHFFPQHVMLLTVGYNMMPMGYWTVISKEPFRFLICMQHGNHTLSLLREYKEAAIHFMPWEDRERVVRAGYISAREGSKAERIGFELQPAVKLQHTRLVAGADNIYETMVHTELEGLSSEFALFVLDVVHSHGSKQPKQRKPIFYYSLKDFSTAGEKWVYKR